MWFEKSLGDSLLWAKTDEGQDPRAGERARWGHDLVGYGGVLGTVVVSPLAQVREYDLLDDFDVWRLEGNSSIRELVSNRYVVGRRTWGNCRGIIFLQH